MKRRKKKNPHLVLVKINLSIFLNIFTKDLIPTIADNGL